MKKKLEYYSLCNDDFENNCTMHVLLTERCNNKCWYCYYYNGKIPPKNVADFNIEIARNACGTLEFDRASEMIDLGYTKAQESLASLT